jgi:exodeoxyribonuclease VII large subunit
MEENGMMADRTTRGASNAPLPFAVAPTRSVSLVRLVSDVARAVGTIGRVTVEGEVHRKTTSAANRSYFTLKDRGAQISVAIPATRQKFCAANDGERVVVTGTLEFVTDRGQLQLVASEIAPVGAGAVAAYIKERRERMRADGLLDRKRIALPLLPNCVGIICGADAAVRKDIESVVASRFPGFPLRVQEVTVSGPGAVESILAGLAILQSDPIVDVIIVARGGGDITQLLPFSDETLCRTIAASPVPIISAIGHDGDNPLSDDVADHRAGTPSIAAAMAVPERTVLVARIDHELRDCANRLDRRLERLHHRVAHVPWQRSLDRLVDRAHARLDQVAIDPLLTRIEERATQRLRAVEWRRGMIRAEERAAQRLASIDWHSGISRQARSSTLALASLERRIEALSPARVLDRGYAIVRNGAGQVVRDLQSAPIGSDISVIVARGELTARVSAVRLEDSPNERFARFAKTGDDPHTVERIAEQQLKNTGAAS